MLFGPKPFATKTQKHQISPNIQLFTSVSGLRSSSFRLRSSVFGLRSSVFGLRSSVFGLRSSSFRLRSSDDIAGFMGSYCLYCLWGSFCLCCSGLNLLPPKLKNTKFHQTYKSLLRSPVFRLPSVSGLPTSFRLRSSDFLPSPVFRLPSVSGLPTSFRLPSSVFGLPSPSLSVSFLPSPFFQLPSPIFRLPSSFSLLPASLSRLPLLRYPKLQAGIGGNRISGIGCCGKAQFNGQCGVNIP